MTHGSAPQGPPLTLLQLPLGRCSRGGGQPEPAAAAARGPAGHAGAPRAPGDPGGEAPWALAATGGRSPWARHIQWGDLGCLWSRSGHGGCVGAPMLLSPAEWPRPPCWWCCCPCWVLGTPHASRPGVSGGDREPWFQPPTAHGSTTLRRGPCRFSYLVSSSTAEKEKGEKKEKFIGSAE